MIWQQTFQTLTRYERGKTDPQPGLAERWTSSADSRKWTLTIADGHTFGGRKPVTAAAVCKNFDTWNRADRAEQGRLSAWSYWFGAFNGKNGALYASCITKGRTITLVFTAALPALPDILTDPAFSVQAPDSMAGDRPLGSGPFVLTSATAAKIDLSAVGAGPKGLRSVQIRPSGNSEAGRAAVAAGALDL